MYAIWTGERPVLAPPCCGPRHALCFVSGRNFFKGCRMLWTVFLVLIVLWMLGVVSSYTLGGFIHVLLVLAVIALLIQLIQGRRVV